MTRLFIKDTAAISSNLLPTMIRQLMKTCESLELILYIRNNKFVVKSLAKGNPHFRKSITRVELLGYGKIKAKQTAEGLEVQLPSPTNDIAPVLKIAK